MVHPEEEIKMLKRYVTKKSGRIFVKAACSDSQTTVLYRAARVALRRKVPVYYQIINADEYKALSLSKAKRIMTAQAWFTEMRDCMVSRMSRKEASMLLSQRMRKKIIAKLDILRSRQHENCQMMDQEIRSMKKKFGL